jgi:fatty-acyl-CoA synthase
VIRLGAERSPACSTSRPARPPGPTSSPSSAELGERLQFDDPINIQFTSGTTGNPRARPCRTTTSSTTASSSARRSAWRATGVHPVPLYHCFGMVMGNLGCLTHGATMVYPSEAFEPLAVLQAVAEERCTASYGVPTMFIAQLDHPDFAGFDLSSLRTGIMAGSPCPIEVMKRVIDKMNMREVTIAYGMTETSPVSFQSGADDSIERRVSTVGRVQPHCEVKIIDNEAASCPAALPASCAPAAIR